MRQSQSDDVSFGMYGHTVFPVCFGFHSHQFKAIDSNMRSKLEIIIKFISKMRNLFVSPFANFLFGFSFGN